MTFRTRILILAVASLGVVLAWIILFLSRKRRARPTGSKAFLLEELFPAGSYLRERCHLSDRKVRSRTRKLMEFNGPADAAQISANAAAAPFTYWMLFFPLTLMVFAITGSGSIFILELLLLVFLCCYFDLWLDRELKRRHGELLREFPSMLTELSLMVNVGIPASQAFERVAATSDGLLYREMQRTVDNMNNGMSTDMALQDLGVRCPLREMRKFLSLYRQNLVKGGPDFAIALEEMAASAWTGRKNAAKTQGELAEQKLLVPTIFMFLGILLIVIVPAFKNIF